MDDLLDQSYETCRRMHRRHDPTYYWATRRLPREIRPATHALYGYVRTADEIVVNGLYPERFTGKEAEVLRAHVNGSAAVRAALTEHERGRIQRSHLRRLKREAGAPVATLPYLFRPQIGLDDYATLAAKLGRDLG